MSEIPASLTTPGFLGRLEALQLLARKVLRGSLQAERRSTRKGGGITFADYAEYHPGDDYRSIDWRVYARTDELLLKLFEVEEDTTVYLLVDVSPSMESKIAYTRVLAAALGYIALHGLERLVVHGISERLTTILEPARGRSKVMAFLRNLEAAGCRGDDTDLAACARAFHARYQRRGIVVVLSDFLIPSGFQEGLRLLQWAGHEVFCLQIHDPEDLRCSWRGDADLTCVETGRRKRATITERDARAYEEAIARWNESLREECARRGFGWVGVTTDQPFETVIRDLLRRGGLVA